MANNPSNADEISIAIGSALSTWTEVEMAVADVFEVVSGMQTVKAHVLMASIISFETRVSICTTLINDDTAWADVSPLWNKVADRLMRCYRSRHQIAHFIFEHGSNSKGSWVKASPYFSLGNAFLGRTKHLGVAEINAKKDRFSELRTAVHWFHLQHKYKMLGKAGAEPKSDLILRLQSSTDQIDEEC